MSDSSTSGSSLLPVWVLEPSGTRIPGVAQVRTRSSNQAFWWGGKKALKIIGSVFACFLPLAFLEPFLFMVWGSIVLSILVLIVGPILHYRYLNETTSFEFVQAECPHCRQSTQLKPYVSTRIMERFTVLCPECGQTSGAVPRSEGVEERTSRDDSSSNRRIGH